MRIRDLTALVVAGVLAQVGREPFAATTILAAIPARVDCPVDAPAHRSVSFREAWRVGGEETEVFLFGVISRAVVDDEGRIYLLDRQLQQVHRFGVDGAYEGVVLHRGEGPGEIDRVSRLEVWPPDRLAAVRAFPPRVIVVDLDGSYVRDLRFYRDASRRDEALRILTAASRRAGVILARGSRTPPGQPGAQEEALIAFDDEGVALRTIAATPRPRRDLSRPKITVRELASFFPGARHTLAPDGTVFLAPERNRYVVERHDIHGGLLLSIHRDVSPRVRTKEEIDAAKNGFAFAATPGTELPDVEYEMEEVEPPIHGLSIVDGRLWVSLDVAEVDLPERCMGRFAVHSLDGALLEERDLIVPFDQDRDALHLLADGRIVRVANYRDAARSARAGRNVQVGETRPGDELVDLEAEALEVIVYEPR